MKFVKRVVLDPALNHKKLGCGTVDPTYESYDILLTRDAFDKNVLILKNCAVQFRNRIPVSNWFTTLQFLNCAAQSRNWVNLQIVWNIYTELGSCACYC